MPLLKKLQTLAIETEATAGTAETLAAADGVINAYNLSIQQNIEVEKRERQGGFASFAGISGMRTGTVSFSTDLEWDGSSTVPFWASECLPACGLVDSSGTFSLTDETPGSNVKTLTIGVYEWSGSGNALLKQIHGASGNVEFIFPTGKKPFANFTFQGAWDTPTDVTNITPTYPTDAIMRYASATTAFNSNALCVNQISFNTGNTLTAKECAGNAFGIDYFLITDRTPTATANPESDLVTNADHYGDIINHTAAELTVTTTGGTGNDTLEVEFPSAQIINAQEGDRGGIQVDDITWQANYHANTPMRVIFTDNA